MFTCRAWLFLFSLILLGGCSCSSDEKELPNYSNKEFLEMGRKGDPNPVSYTHLTLPTTPYV